VYEVDGARYKYAAREFVEFCARPEAFSQPIQIEAAAIAAG
jgi:hypothetical protein